MSNIDPVTAAKRQWADIQTRAETHERASRPAREDVERRAVAQLRELLPLYEARLRAAEALAGPLAEFAKTEQRLRAALDRIESDAGLNALPPDLRDRALGELRMRAGLARNHQEIGLEVWPSRTGIARAVLYGVMNGVIASDAIRVGPHVVTFTSGNGSI